MADRAAAGPLFQKIAVRSRFCSRRAVLRLVRDERDANDRPGYRRVNTPLPKARGRHRCLNEHQGVERPWQAGRAIIAHDGRANDMAAQAVGERVEAGGAPPRLGTGRFHFVRNYLQACQQLSDGEPADELCPILWRLYAESVTPSNACYAEPPTNAGYPMKTAR